MSLYFIVILATIAGPFLLSFDKKIHFYTFWKFLFPAIVMVSVPFIIWDEIFTQWGLWGFTPHYLQGWYLGHLPLEEICFFLFVPYACVFIYEVIKGYFPNFQSRIFTHYFAFGFTLLAFSLGIFFVNNLYTAVACIMAAILTVGIYFLRKEVWFPRFVVSFFIVQIPFFLVNGILTGMFTENPIVWYNNAETIGYRFGTIPIEDIFYNYSMLLLVFFFYELFKKKRSEIE
ncbi:MAG: lycopene cyclase domain-containing protein [Crocinitomicaceae bacterium]